MTRELRLVRTEQVLGTISVTADGTVTYTGRAEDVLARTVKRFGARDLIANGWSNGYLYLADATP